VTDSPSGAEPSVRAESTLPPVVAWQPTAPRNPALGADYRATGTLGKVAAAIIGISVVLNALDAAFSVYGIGLLEDLAHTSNQQLEDFDSTVALISLGIFIAFIGGGIVFLTWLRRLVGNVRALGDGDSANTPNWSVIWWFVPFASLFKPHQIVGDAWTRLAATPAEDSKRIVNAWWGTYVVGNYLGFVIGRLPARTVADFIGQQKFNIFIDVLVVIAGILIVKIILELERRSNVRVRAVSSGEYVPLQRRYGTPVNLDETAPKWSSD
jgi:hypothetical protein